MTLNPSRLKEVCNQVIELATETAVFLRTECENFDLSKIEHKGARDLVSYVDKEAEKKIVKRLSEILPEAGFVTEEGTVEQATNGLRWVIDPLDGTTNFLHKLPPFSISIALLDDEEILVGVVYEVNLKECFHAYKGGGAFMNGKVINVSPIPTLEESLIVAGFPYNVEDKVDAYFEILKEMVKTTHGIRRLGSAAVDLAYVACGRFNAYFEFNLKIWDIAAGILIVREAGGTVTDFTGGNGFLYGKEL
ncbi:MAG TPA: inositol monophosphatase family protein, partial [Cytophagaceae bacterium]